MSDYRFTMEQHNGIDCLHVMIDVNEDTYDAEVQHTYIPLDDVLAAAVAQGYMSLSSKESTPQQDNSKQ